jgi:hypothetical protein
LRAFKSQFLNYLNQFFDNSIFDEITIIKRIKGKKTINLKDIEDLFREEIFKGYFKNYFKNKQIYRDLMQKEISLKRKKAYHRILSIF